MARRRSDAAEHLVSRAHASISGARRTGDFARGRRDEGLRGRGLRRRQVPTHSVEAELKRVFHAPGDRRHDDHPGRLPDRGAPTVSECVVHLKRFRHVGIDAEVRRQQLGILAEFPYLLVRLLPHFVKLVIVEKK